MAQAVFEDHPLESYLLELGEGSPSIPGSDPDCAPLSFDEDLGASPDAEHGSYDTFLSRLINNVLYILSTGHISAQPNPFVERFKYDVISSSLLSSTLSSSRRSPSPPSHPGALSSADPLSTSPRIMYQQRDELYSSRPKASSWMWWLAAIVSFGTGHYTLTALAIGGSLISISPDGPTKTALPPLLQTLDELIVAGETWDSLVHDAINTLESNDPNISPGATTPSSPFSSLRLSLNSALHTSQSQFDNVRQLLAALTSPSELPQLSEMYAPPSPSRHSPERLDLHASRHLALSGTWTSPRPRASSLHAKRTSWNGPYASTMSGSGSPTTRLPSRRDRRRSDLSSLLQQSSPFQSVSAPATPLKTTPVLSGVAEEQLTGEIPPENPSFGSTALELRRKRKSAGLDSLGLRHSNSSYFRLSRPPHGTISSGTRFTTLHASRHSLSLPALHLALQGALSAKRYACAHLLALRFTEDEDDGYWEDVQSVMGLLTTTFVDAASRLREALEEVEHIRRMDETPTPESESRRTSYASAREEALMNAQHREDGKTFKLHLTESLRQSFTEDNPFVSDAGPSTHRGSPISFAPMPSHITRFATHVEAISNALADARVNLAECVASLRNEPNQGRRRPTSHSNDESIEPPALQAYERLRRELGFALRECERGRERLLEIVTPRTPDDADRTDDGDMPALGPDHGSDSDKADSSLVPDDEGDRDQPISFTVVVPDTAEDSFALPDVDDATAHLLQDASTAHLPPVGAEQVFESDCGAAGPFTRERSKLSREERILLAKARRESAGGRLSVLDDVGSTGSGVHERWGPGGEVVQELKDVIWKVGERRRRITSGAADTTAGLDEGQPWIDNS